MFLTNSSNPAALWAARVLIPIEPGNKKGPTWGPFLFGGERGINSRLPWRSPLRALAALRVPIGCPADRQTLSRFAQRVLTLLTTQIKKPRSRRGFFIWRRERDSNPRYGYKPYTRFPGEPIQPLWHLSINLVLLKLQSLSRFAAMRSGLLRASCPPPSGPPRFAAAFKFDPVEFVEPSVRL